MNRIIGERWRRGATTIVRRHQLHGKWWCGRLLQRAGGAGVGSTTNNFSSSSTPDPSASFSPSSDSHSVHDSILDLAKDYSIEITPAAAKRIASFESLAELPAGTEVNVTYLVGSDAEDSIQLCQRLSQASLCPIAHVPARAFPDLDAVDRYLSKCKEAGVKEVLVLGGGAETPAGKLHETMQVLESGLLQRHGFTTVGVAAHPEGHPELNDKELMEFAIKKAEWAASEGIDLFYETQFCFDPAPIVAWERSLREDLTTRLLPLDHPSNESDSNDASSSSPLPSVRLGLAGPAKINKLIKFGLMSGVGASIGFLKKNAGSVLKLASTAAPDAVIAGLAAHRLAEPQCLVDSLHYYPFGGFTATLNYANGVEEGRFSMKESAVEGEIGSVQGFTLYEE